MKNYFHLFSNGADAKDLILSEQDYKAAVNRIGICSALTEATILGFSIESTHLYGLLYADYAEADDFGKQYHRLTTSYNSRNRADKSGCELNLEMYRIDSVPKRMTCPQTGLSATV